MGDGRGAHLVPLLAQVSCSQRVMALLTLILILMILLMTVTKMRHSVASLVLLAVLGVDCITVNGGVRAERGDELKDHRRFVRCGTFFRPFWLLTNIISKNTL